MPLLKLRHEIHCDIPTFWRTFFDQELTRRLFLEGLEFHAYETLRQEETPTAISRAVAVEPKLSMPAPLARAFGSKFRYTEEGTFDRATSVWRWKMIPGVLPGKIRVEGVLRAVPIGENRVAREAEIDIEAKVFMLGGLIEDTFKKQLSEGWQRSAEVQNQWMAAAP